MIVETKTSREISWISINCGFHGNLRNSGLALYLKIVVLVPTISAPNFMLVSKSAQFAWSFELCRRTRRSYDDLSDSVLLLASVHLSYMLTRVIMISKMVQSWVHMRTHPSHIKPQWRPMQRHETSFPSPRPPPLPNDLWWPRVA